MGMLMKTPKYQRPPEMDASSAALAERDKRAEAEEKKQIRSLASRRNALKTGGMMNEENLDLLTGGTSVQPQSFRDPMKDERYR
tara:strand:- start:1925 stop:2176 length:252 start_codon:yes stop_codon:yes gene_type:complete